MNELTIKIRLAIQFSHLLIGGVIAIAYLVALSGETRPLRRRRQMKRVRMHGLACRSARIKIEQYAGDSLLPSSEELSSQPKLMVETENVQD